MPKESVDKHNQLSRWINSPIRSGWPLLVLGIPWRPKILWKIMAALGHDTFSYPFSGSHFGE
jgi:hypothetical protein